MSSCSRRPKKRGESSPPVEDWQLRILWEWQQKQQPPSYPSLEQRRSLATQTGLNIKWISSWFKKVDGVSSKKRIGAAAKRALSGSPIVAAATHGPGSPKLAGLKETILPSLTGVPHSAAEDPFLVYPPDIGVNVVSKSSVSHLTRESPSAADLVLVPDSDLQTNRDHLVLCSSSRSARLVQVSESSPSALLRSQCTTNSCGTTLGYGFASSLQHVSSPDSLLSVSQPPSSWGSHTPHETHYFHATLGGSQSVVPAYPRYTAHDSRPASACMHPDNSVPTLFTSEPSLVPLPSIYWLLFDRDEHSIGGRNGTHRGTPLSPPPLGGLGSSGVSAASQVGATPVSFLAKWEDILALQFRVGSSFVKNLSQARQAHSPEVTLIEQGDLGASLTKSEHNALTYPRRVQPSSSADES